MPTLAEFYPDAHITTPPHAKGPLAPDKVHIRRPNYSSSVQITLLTCIETSYSLRLDTLEHDGARWSNGASNKCNFARSENIDGANVAG